MVPVHGRKCLSRKRFSVGDKCFADDEVVETEMAEMAGTTDKRLLSCGFQRTDKAMGQVYQCWWRICRETNVFSSFEYYMFYVLYQFVTYLLTLPRIKLIRSESRILLYFLDFPQFNYDDANF
jgi:hypothetical protein